MRVWHAGASLWELVCGTMCDFIRITTSAHGFIRRRVDESIMVPHPPTNSCEAASSKYVLQAQQSETAKK